MNDHNKQRSPGQGYARCAHWGPPLLGRHIGGSDNGEPFALISLGRLGRFFSFLGATTQAQHHAAPAPAQLDGVRRAAEQATHCLSDRSVPRSTRPSCFTVGRRHQNGSCGESKIQRRFVQSRRFNDVSFAIFSGLGQEIALQ
jgi:hypothetical protein